MMTVGEDKAPFNVLFLCTGGLRSKSWNEFSGLDAPKLDFVFTVSGSDPASAA